MNNQALMDMMVDFAQTTFDGKDIMMPMFFLMNEEGHFSVYATPFSNDREKDMTSALIRSEVKKQKAVRLGFMSETWRVVAIPANTTPEEARKIIPSEHPDREEAILITVEDCDGQGLSGMIKIVRDQDGNGKLLPYEQSKFHKTEGRFAGFFDKPMVH